MNNQSEEYKEEDFSHLYSDTDKMIGDQQTVKHRSGAGGD